MNDATHGPTRWTCQDQISGHSRRSSSSDHTT